MWIEGIVTGSDNHRVVFTPEQRRAKNQSPNPPHTKRALHRQNENLKSSAKRRVPAAAPGTQLTPARLPANAAVHLSMDGSRGFELEACQE